MRYHDKLLSPTEASAWLNVTTNTLRAWRQAGKGPPYVKLDNGKIRYSAAGVSGYLYDREARGQEYKHDAALKDVLKRLQRAAIKEGERDALRLGLERIGVDAAGVRQEVKRGGRWASRYDGWCSRCGRKVRTWKPGPDRGSVCWLCVRELDKAEHEAQRRGYDVDPPKEKRDPMDWLRETIGMDTDDQAS
jgi:hypothetical protein